MASINKGDNTGAFGNDFLRIYLNNPNDLYITKAVFQINGNLEKEFEDPKFPLRINFTGAETELLAQVNKCKLALWDEYGRRKTADGKFTFFCKENRINQPDAPIYEGEEYYPEENSVYFDLQDSEFACEFVINATPAKMSELQQDIYLMTPDKIKGGVNVSTEVDDSGNVTINASLDAKQSYNDLDDKPSINGIELVGDVEIKLADEVPQADWNETDETSLAFIQNKPYLAPVAQTASYNDLVNKPTIPSKVSQLTNDSEFISKDTTELENYYNKEEVDSLVAHDIDLQPVYNKIDEVQTELKEDIIDLKQNKVDTDTFEIITGRLETADDEILLQMNERFTDVNSELSTKASKSDLADLEAIVETVITEDDLNDALNLKANKTDLGNGKLTIKVNNEDKGNFYANQKADSNINITIPTKTSELTNDAEFVTAEEISLDTLATKQELIDGLGSKLDNSSLKDGITTFKVNGNTVGSTSANQSVSKTINITTPTKLSDLEQDIDYLMEDDLSTINEQITSLQEDSETAFERINLLDSALDNKVTISNTKSMVDNTEINRLKNVDNYDDTEIRTQVNTLQTAVDGFDTDISNKVDKVSGKGLSTNDFTDLYKDKVDNAYTLGQTTAAELARTEATVEELVVEVPGIQTAIDGIRTNITDETTARTDADNNLQSQIEALQAKSTVVDILATEEDLNGYDTSGLLPKDVICILKDSTKHNTVSYYRWNGSDFTYVGSEGVYYTRSESDDKYVPKELEINGKALNADINLTYTDVQALSESTFISNKTIVIQRNQQQVEQFTLNQANNTVIDIDVPVSVSELENDSNYVSVEVLKQTYLGSPSSTYGDGDDTLLWDKAYYLEDKINANTTRITALEGNLPTVALTGDYNDLLNKPTIPSRTSQLTNDSGYITMESIDLSDYALLTDIPTAVSQLENDRGYITINSLGKGDVTIYLQDEVISTFNVNTKDDIMVTIPVDTALSTTSINPVQNKLITNELNLKAVDTKVVHNTGEETIAGNKTFTGDVIVPTQVTNDNSNKVATTAFVKNQDYCTNNNAVHKSETEIISGSKTFTGTTTFSGSTSLSFATGVTVATNDNSTKLATTAWVKNQNYAADNQVVHDGGDETINGNKTFAETTTFTGITNLSGTITHVNTPDGTVNDAVVNVSYLNTCLASQSSSIAQDLTNYYTKAEVDALLLDKQNQIDNLNSTITGLVTRIESLETYMQG